MEDQECRAEFGERLSKRHSLDMRERDDWGVGKHKLRGEEEVNRAN